MDEDKELDLPKEEYKSNVDESTTEGKRLHLGRLFTKALADENVAQDLVALKILSDNSPENFMYGHENFVFDLTDLLEGLNEEISDENKVKNNQRFI